MRLKAFASMFFKKIKDNCHRALFCEYLTFCADRNINIKNLLQFKEKILEDTTFNKPFYQDLGHPYDLKLGTGLPKDPG